MNSRDEDTVWVIAFWVVIIAWLAAIIVSGMSERNSPKSQHRLTPTIEAN